MFELPTYYPPRGFCFDQFCDDEPIKDDRRLEGYNLDFVLNNFINFIKKQAKHFRTNHLMVLMGGDFHYSNANTYYENLDKLIMHLNEKV